MKKLILKYIGCDSWDRPLYQNEEGVIFVDVSPLSRCVPEICTKMNNKPEGEPDTPISVMSLYKGLEIEFVPQRAVWQRDESKIPELKIGDNVTYTNENGVEFPGHTVTGFCDWKWDTFKGRVFIDSDSPWFPVEKTRLKLEENTAHND